ncbi:hypothetical protein ABZP26_12775 [Pseudoalteromonas sp. SD03]|uniref:HTH cro/C1-type domain-containing protein n=1 Tax=Pseudoalteromonas sp. SD03 TaxID=3231719 RepID=A0AB39ANP4_9GAMM
MVYNFGEELGIGESGVINILKNKNIIPFKKEALALLEELQCKIHSYEKDGYYEWVDEYKRRYSEVLNYVNNGAIPHCGFSDNLRFSDLPCVPDLVRRRRFYGYDDANLKKAVQSAGYFWLPVSFESLEVFYAICTSSTHTSCIRSKTGYNEPVNFARALPELRNSEWYICCRFQNYVIERGDSLNLPFKFTRSDDSTLIIGKDFDFNKTVQEFSRTILDLYKGVYTSINKSYSKNIKLDVFVLDNDINFRSCIENALDLLNGVSLPRNRKIIIKEVLEGYSDKESYIPNYRITISDTQDLVECYLTLLFIPLPSFVEMITHRAKSLEHSLKTIPKHPTEFPNILIDTLRSDLQIVCNYRSELRGISEEVDLYKYENYVNEGRIPGYAQYNFQMNWELIPRNIFIAVYELFETYNHHQTLDDSIAKLPAKFDIDDELQEHILRSLQSFGRDTSNYLKENNSKGQTFKNETQITSKLVTYLDNHKQYIVHGESKEGAGRLDIKIEYKYSNRKPLMIEGKLFKIAEGVKKPKESKIHETFNSSIRQIEHYTDHGDSVGMLLFFTLDLNEGEIAQIIGKKSSSNGFSKIPKSLQKNKINYVVKKGGRDYPIRFMKLSSKPPSKR